jgi:hypothetical protein
MAIAQDDGDMGEIECFGSEGATISMLGVWTGEEEETFKSILEPLLNACDLSLSYEGTRDLSTVLGTRVEGGSAPDVASLPNPGSLVNYQDSLVPLEEVGVNADNYAEGWVERGSISGTWYGLPVKSDVKSLVWYSPANFESLGYEEPQNWDGFVNLLQTINEDGTFTPLSFGIESGGATGWPATDFIQDLLLRQQGNDYVSGLITGETNWDDEGVVQAWQQYVDWVNQYNAGGADAALTTNFRDAILQPFQDPPEGLMVRQSGFAGSAVIQPNFEDFTYGEDYAFFVLPSPEGETAPIQVGGDFIGVFNNTDAVRALINYLSSPQGATSWAQAGFDLTPNEAVNVEDYPDQLNRDKAQALADAPDVSFDVGDALPAEVGQAEFDGITEAVGGGDISSILSGIEETYTEVVGEGMEMEEDMDEDMDEGMDEDADDTMDDTEDDMDEDEDTNSE